MEITISHELDEFLGYDDVCDLCGSITDFCWRDIYPGWGPNCAKLAEYLNDEYGITRGHCEWDGDGELTVEEMAGILLTAIETSDTMVP